MTVAPISAGVDAVVMRELTDESQVATANVVHVLDAAPPFWLTGSDPGPFPLLDEPLPERMLEVQDRVHRPVEVVGEVGYLLEQLVQGVA